MRILLVGAGAVGTFYASKLQTEATTVGVVARSNYAAIAAGGVEMHTHSFGSYTFVPSAVYASVADAGADWDVVIVATKATDNAAVAETLAPALARAALVIVQNGVAIEDTFQARFPDTPIVSAVAIVSCEMTAPAVMQQYRWTRLHLGPYVNESGVARTAAEASRAEAGARAAGALASIFAAAGLTDALVHDARELQFVRWHKVMINAIVNPASVLGGCVTADEMLGDAALRALIHDGMYEIKAAAERVLGGAMPASFAEPPAITASIARNRGGRSSMVQDWQAGRALELNAILRNPIDVAARHGMALPRVHTMYALLHCAQRKRDRN